MNIIEFSYYAGYLFKKKRSLKTQKRLRHRVISVGNMTLGGTGKTPLVIALALEALKRGFKPCILTRGYKGRVRYPSFVSRGNGPLMSISQAGDEPVLMAQKLRNVEIIKGRNRYEAGLLSEKADLFILDDGFQHRRLYRDMDIVLIDALRGFGNGRLFPIGPLREPLSELGRADMIVITRGNHDENVNLIKKTLSKTFQNLTPSVYTAHHKPSFFMDNKGNRYDINDISGKKVFAFCGIGNPDAFIHTLQSTGANITGVKQFKDHCNYRKSDIIKLLKEAHRNQADWLVTTEKDIIKIKEFGRIDNLFALCVDFIIENSFYDRVFQEAST